MTTDAPIESAAAAHSPSGTHHYYSVGDGVASQIHKFHPFALLPVYD